ncbi:hypothetical protein [Streptomyces beihaiensis]|uniref:Uncharacterized protein n=1 Tax=Streptomyces beihaiensis TaxID=2984495 RepID=A0ABT3U1B3_9ACTN|nr:hypothetical protein [Streptomyces beihaiensis]MCX3061978.1 hypothetical protein [Streptomyces beihaiensis]
MSVTSRTLLAGAVAAALAVLITVLATTVGDVGAFEGAATDHDTAPERTVRVVADWSGCVHPHRQGEMS